jgi:protein ImuB
MARRRLLSLQFGAPDELPALALWCQHYTPLTAVDPPDGVMLDITGCAHLFGGEAGLKAQLLRRLPGARLSIADTAAAAWGLARYAAPGVEDFLSLPLAALRLEANIMVKLRRVGVRNVADLQRLPRAGLVAGYGAESALRLAQALGEAPEALRFYAAPPDWREVEHYAEPVLLPAQLQAALQRLSTKLCNRLGLAARGAMALSARFYRIDLQCPEIALKFAAPCRDAAQIAKLLMEKLAQEVDPGFGVEGLALEAHATEPLAPVQRDITGEASDGVNTLNTLLNRLGSGRLWRAAPYASYIPEYAARRAAVTVPPVPWAKPPHPRPMRLLPQPAPITAIAPVQDDPPVVPCAG